MLRSRTLVRQHDLEDLDDQRMGGKTANKPLLTREVVMSRSSFQSRCRRAGGWADEPGTNFSYPLPLRLLAA